MLQEELLEVSVHSELQANFYPRIQRIASTVNAMQDEVGGSYFNEPHVSHFQVNTWASRQR